MIYGHVADGVVDNIGVPPIAGWDGARWVDLTLLRPDDMASVGWYPVRVTQKPEPTDTEAHEAHYELVDDVIVQTWNPRPKTPEELQADSEARNRVSIEEALVASMLTLRAIRDDTNPNINQNPAARIKEIAKILLQVNRALLRRYDGIN